MPHSKTSYYFSLKHVRGAKHYFFHPNEIPNYKPSKEFNPCHQKKLNRTAMNMRAPSQQQNVFRMSRLKESINEMNNGIYSTYLYPVAPYIIYTE